MSASPNITLPLDDELFIRRPGGIVLHGHVANGEIGITLQIRGADTSAPMAAWGLAIATAPPEKVFIDADRSPPTLVVGDEGTLFVLAEQDAVAAWQFIERATTAITGEEARNA